MKINSQIKSRSITSKASSACKINMGLVQGARDMHASKAFVDHGETVRKSLDETLGASPSTEENKEEKKEEKKGQADKAVTVPSEK